MRWCICCCLRCTGSGLAPSARLAALRAIEPAARATAESGDVYPLLTLRMGLGARQAMIDAAREFEREFAADRWA